jgi:hypothetical protein
MNPDVLNRVYKALSGIIHWNDPGNANHIRKKRQDIQKMKMCKITGLNISMQPDSSKFLSRTGVEWYYRNDPELYKSMLEPRLQEHWKKEPLEVQFREIAHLIRDEDSNRRHSTRRQIDKILQEKNVLFDNYKLIAKDKLKAAGMI